VRVLVGLLSAGYSNTKSLNLRFGKIDVNPICDRRLAGGLVLLCWPVDTR